VELPRHGKKKYKDMTKVLYGVGVSGLSGSDNKKAGGQTWSKDNRVRQRNGSPNQPNTAAQQLLKTALTSITQKWRTELTPVEIAGWNTAAALPEWAFTDKLTGTQYQGTGIALYTRLCGNLTFLNQAPTLLMSAPVKGMPGDTFVTEVVADASAGTVAFTYTGTLGINETHVFSLSPVRGSGQAAFRANTLRFIDDSLGVSPVALGAAYVAKYGVITAEEGNNISYEVVAINSSTGQKRIAGRGVIAIVA